MDIFKLMQKSPFPHSNKVTPSPSFYISVNYPIEKKLYIIIYFSLIHQPYPIHRQIMLHLTQKPILIDQLLSISMSTTCLQVIMLSHKDLCNNLLPNLPVSGFANPNQFSISSQNDFNDIDQIISSLFLAYKKCPLPVPSLFLSCTIPQTFTLHFYCLILDPLPFQIHAYLESLF